MTKAGNRAAQSDVPYSPSHPSNVAECAAHMPADDEGKPATEHFEESEGCTVDDGQLEGDIGDFFDFL